MAGGDGHHVLHAVARQHIGVDFEYPRVGALPAREPALAATDDDDAVEMLRCVSVDEGAQGVRRGRRAPGVDQPDPWAGRGRPGMRAGRREVWRPLDPGAGGDQIGGQVVGQAVGATHRKAGEAGQQGVYLAGGAAGCFRHGHAGQAQGEARTLARCALHADIAAHQFGQVARDGQPQPGAAEAPRGRGVGLGEGGEEARLGGFVHADAVVGDMDVDDDLSGFACGQHGAHRHMALPPLPAGEFDGVVGQVDQHLAQARRIAENLCGQRRVGEQRQFHSFFQGQMVEHAAGLFHHLGDRCRHLFDLQLAGLDLREIQDVVDHTQQRCAGVVDLADIVALLGRHLSLQRQVREADDRVHRRAQLVTHVGKEPALRLRGLAQVPVCLFQFARALGNQLLEVIAMLLELQLGLSALRDVLERAANSDDGAGRIADGHTHRPDPHASPARRDDLKLLVVRHAVGHCGREHLGDPVTILRGVEGDSLIHRRRVPDGHLVDRSDLRRPVHESTGQVDSPAAEMCQPAGQAHQLVPIADGLLGTLVQDDLPGDIGDVRGDLHVDRTVGGGLVGHSQHGDGPAVPDHRHLEHSGQGRMTRRKTRALRK